MQHPERTSFLIGAESLRIRTLPGNPLIGLHAGGEWLQVTATDHQHGLTGPSNPETDGQVIRLCQQGICNRLMQEHQGHPTPLPAGSHPPLRDTKQGAARSMGEQPTDHHIAIEQHLADLIVALPQRRIGGCWPSPGGGPAVGTAPSGTAGLAPSPARSPAKSDRYAAIAAPEARASGRGPQHQRGAVAQA